MAYDDPVIKVMVEDSQISVEVEARQFGNTVTVQDHEIDRLEWWKCIHACILEVLGRDGQRRCPACGKTLVPQQKYCSGTCRKFAMPQPPTREIVELANKRIRKLIACVAEGDRKLRQSLTDEYIIKI